MFVGSSIQKPKFSSALDEVVPFYDDYRFC
jgi:hypothetical protein